MEIRIPGVKLNSGFPEASVTPGFRSHPDASTIPESHGNPVSQDNMELQVPWVTRDSGNMGFRVTPWTRSSGWLGETGVPGDSWDAESSELFREPGVLRMTPGTRSPPGDFRNLEFRVTPVTRSSSWIAKPRVPVDSGNTEFRLAPGTWSSG